MKRLMLAAALVAVLLLAQAEAAAPRRWAVVIGLDQYANSGIAPLKYAVADARTLADTLRATPGFSGRDIFELTSDKTGDEAPTRTNIAFRFDYLAREVQPGDELVVFFSGHGLEVDGQTFLLTQETDPRSLRTLQQSALHARDLISWLRSTKASRVLLVVDACRNDPASARSTADNALSPGLARDLALVDAPVEVQHGPSAVATLFACSSGQRSYEWHDRGHGFFTYYLVEGLKGGAADPQGRVTLGSLVNYVQREVPEASQRWVLQRQEPWLRYEGPGADTWLLNQGGLAAVPTTPRPAPPPPPVAPPPPTGPKVLQVSQAGDTPYSTIGAALDAAGPGARIQVRAGEYEEAVVITRPVHLVGEPGTLIRGPEGSPAVEVRAKTGVRLEHLILESRVPAEPIVGRPFMNDVRLVRVRQYTVPVSEDPQP